MLYAIIKDGYVDNIAVFTSVPSPNHAAAINGEFAYIPDNIPVFIGDRYENGVFYSPTDLEREALMPELQEPTVPIDLSAIIKGAIAFVPEGQADEAQMTIDDTVDRLEAMRIILGEVNDE